jgi:nucleoside-specific outer membrane channel protein Tsx
MTNLLRSFVALALVAAAPVASAGGFSTANVQAIQGYGFNDVLNPAAADQDVTTLTFNHFAAFGGGDSFFFADLTRNQDDVTGLYAEWHPRLFLNQLLGQEKPLLGIFKNYGPAFEVNYAQNFYAYLAGFGVDFAIPGPYVLGLNVFYRYDRFSTHQWQVSPFWTVPFKLGKVPFVFGGFVDLNGATVGGQDELEIWAQPQLMVDALALFGRTPGKFFVGTEFFYHRLAEEQTAVPQLMVQWTVF